MEAAAEISVEFLCKLMNLQCAMDRSSKSTCMTCSVSGLTSSIAVATLQMLTDDLMTSAAVTCNLYGMPFARNLTTFAGDLYPGPGNTP